MRFFPDGSGGWITLRGLQQNDGCAPIHFAAMKEETMR